MCTHVLAYAHILTYAHILADGVLPGEELLVDYGAG